jgi:hypothetical protein
MSREQSDEECPQGSVNEAIPHMRDLIVIKSRLLRIKILIEVFINSTPQKSLFFIK